ncbi:MAG: exonuclease domain-containing protein [Bacteroidota bacterium]
MFAIVDIETTGSFAKGDGITEIAAVLSDGKKILDEFQTLINPNQEIPAFITSLTGINNEMVVDAPYFEEISKELFDFLDGHIFVAHNVQFDYNFIRAAFEKEGIVYSSKRLCTVRLSRKIIADSKGYSLSKITNFLGITNASPHRAMGDARATAELFHELMSRDDVGLIESYLKSNSHETILPLQLDKKDFTSLPHLPGVYFFSDSKGKIIYIGKAKNLKKRVSSHFSGTPNNKRRHFFHTEIAKIQFELSGCELLLLWLRKDKKQFFSSKQ